MCCFRIPSLGYKLSEGMVGWNNSRFKKKYLFIICPAIVFLKDNLGKIFIEFVLYFPYPFSGQNDFVMGTGKKWKAVCME